MGNETDVSQIVVRYVAEEIWEAFPYPPVVNGKIVWEYGIVETLVGEILHGRGERTLFNRFEESHKREFFWIAYKACELADELAEKRPAVLLLLLGGADIPRDPRLTKEAGLEEIAEEVFQSPSGSFLRKFERARAAVKEIVLKLEGVQRARLDELGKLGPASQINPKVASKYPRVFKSLDKKLRSQK